MAKELRKCEICKRSKWFNKKPKNYSWLKNKEQVKYLICLNCRMLGQQMRNSMNSKHNINIAEENMV